MGVENNFSRQTYATYLHRVLGRMSNLRCSYEVRSSGASRNKRTGLSDTENVTYNCTLNFGTCKSLEDYIHFALMYTVDHILTVLPIKYLINKYGDPTTPFKLATGSKPPVSHLCVLFFTCAARKDIAHVGTKVLNMRHQSQKGFDGIFVGKGYLVYVPHRRNIISLHNVVFDERLSSALAYSPQPYSEAMTMKPAVLYIPYVTSSRKKLAI